MAALAFDAFVRRSPVLPDIGFVTFSAGILPTVLHGKILPFLNIAEAMIIVGEAVAVNAKVVRDQKTPGQEYQPY